MKITNNPKRALMIIMGALVLIGFGIANIFYNYENSSVDPRVNEARKLYSKYDTYAQENNFNAVFSLLDSIEPLYSSIEHYKNSFEVGVLYNNRAAAYLSMAIYFENNSLSLDGKITLSKDTLLGLSEKAVMQSIHIYEEWLDNYAEKTDTELEQTIKNSFLSGLQSHSEKEKSRFLSKRISEITDAQLETPRRLSVAYTNLGIVKRHKENYKEAIEHYTKAMELWDRNLAAENNLNKLLDRPLKKQNMLEKIFPPEKDK
jgi:tetratricopeptide (TPR) repeat protein